MKKRIIYLLLLVTALLALSACAKQEASESLYFLEDGAIYKRLGTLRSEQVLLAADKIGLQISAHPESAGFYYAVIPDKSSFVRDQSGWSEADRGSMVDIIHENAPDAEYIELSGTLGAEDYYRTDLHWRQERILTVAAALCEGMGAAAPETSDFTKTEVGDFTGSLAAQSGLSVEPEKLYIMESDASKNAVVTDYEQNTLPVYSPEKLDSDEPYDVFLSGAQPVLTLENPNAETDKTLVIFRDSFGSSIAPLLLPSYSKITLVDLRYIMGSIVSDYVDFDGADVLFLYSEALLNSGGILK